MIDEETRRKLRELSMGEMVEALDLQEADRTSMAVPFDERIRMMVDYAWEAKRASSVRRLVQRARLRFPDAEMGEMIYDGRGIDGVLIREAGTCQFMESASNVVIEGCTGTGKSYLACCLAVSATAKSAERATLSRRRRPRFPAGGATALWPPALPRAAAQGALDRGVVEVRGPDLNLQRRGALGVPGRDRPARDLPSAELREPDRHRDVLCAERGQPPRGVRGPHDCPLSGSPSPSAASASRSFMR